MSKAQKEESITKKKGTSPGNPSIKTEHKPAKKRSFWPPVPSALLVVSVYLLSQVVAGVLLLMYPVALGWNADQVDSWVKSATGQFWAILLVEAAVVGMLWFLLKVRGFRFKDIGWKRLKGRDFLYALSGFGIYFLLYVAIAVIAQIVSPNLNLNQEQQIGFEATKEALELLMVFVSLVVLPPIVEELLMRGFLYTGLRSKWPVWASALVTSVLFAMAHLQFGSGAPLLWVAAIDTFALSLVLVYLREKTGSLGAPILLHGLKNGIAFTLLFIVGVN